MKVAKSTMTHEDIMSVVANCANAGSTLQHKSMVLSYHFVREHFYGDVVEIRKIGTNDNISDALTKGLDPSGLKNGVMPAMSE